MKCSPLIMDLQYNMNHSSHRHVLEYGQDSSCLGEQHSFHSEKGLKQKQQFHCHDDEQDRNQQIQHLQGHQNIMTKLGANCKWQHHSLETHVPQKVQKSYEIQQDFHESTNSERNAISNVAIYPNSHNTDTLDQMDEECEEDIDEDSSSDFEEEEQLRQIYNLQKERLVQMNTTSSLLRFADSVTDELQKYLARTKDQEDSCDIYENKWATTKSGRELYYADLLRIAQGDTDSSSKSKKRPASSLTTYTQSSSSPKLPSLPEKSENFNQYKGIREPSKGLGPFEELFEIGLRNNVSEKARSTFPVMCSVSDKGVNYEYLPSSLVNEHKGSRENTVKETIPMHERLFPESFWKEPVTLVKRDLQDLYTCNYQQRGMYPVTQKLPDFTDLMESWQGEMGKTHNIHNDEMDRTGEGINSNRF